MGKKKLYHKSSASWDHSSQGSTHAPQSAKLIQHMMMGSFWIQQQSLRNPQNVPTWATWKSKNNEATAGLVRAPKGSQHRDPPPHLHTLITITPTTSYSWNWKKKKNFWWPQPHRNSHDRGVHLHPIEQISQHKWRWGAPKSSSKP
jgi:hypothetical protein